MRSLLITPLLVFCCTLSFAQDKFMTGSSTVSIEPDTSLVSAALAGYGVPREGRFSLVWKRAEQEKQLKAITSFKKELLALTSNGELLTGVSMDQSVRWKIVGKAKNLADITALNDEIYGLNIKGELLKARFGKTISWKKVKQYNQLTAITSLGNRLYACSKAERVLEGEMRGNSVKWKEIASVKGLISLTSDSRMLYALNKNDTIWSVKPYLGKKGWTIIGRNNDITFNERLKDIAVVNKVIYAINNDQQLLQGYHKSNGDMAVNTLAIKNKNQTVVIAGVDVCGFDGSFIKSIKDHLYKTRGLSPASILINASHTHFAPVTQAWTTWGEFYHTPDSNYLNNVVKVSIIKSIETALDNMSPANLLFGRGTTTIGSNRRNTPAVTRPYDNTLDVIKIVEGEKTKSVLFSAGCHPVFENKGAESYTLGGNYPAVARKYVTSQLNSIHSIFLQGCGGDINPRESNYHATGNALGGDVLKTLNTLMKPLSNTISFYLDTIRVPVSPWPLSKVEEFKAENSTKPGDIEAEKNVRWADLMIKRYKENKVENNLPVYVQTINIGEWKLVGLSREVVTEYGLAIRKLWPDKLVTVAGYCNDVSSYLPVNWHIETGVYEGNGSFFWYGQSGLPPTDILSKIIGEIKENNR